MSSDTHTITSTSLSCDPQAVEGLADELLRPNLDCGYDAAELIDEHGAALAAAACLRAQLAASGLELEPRLSPPLAADGDDGYPAVYLAAENDFRLLPVFVDGEQPQLSAWFAGAFPCAGLAFVREAGDDGIDLLGYCLHSDLGDAAGWGGLRLEARRLLSADGFAKEVRALRPEEITAMQTSAPIPAEELDAQIISLLAAARTAAMPEAAASNPQPGSNPVQSGVGQPLRRVAVQFAARRAGEALDFLAEQAQAAIVQLLWVRRVAIARGGGTDGPAAADTLDGYFSQRLELPGGGQVELQLHPVQGLRGPEPRLRFELLPGEGASGEELAGRLQLRRAADGGGGQSIDWITPRGAAAWLRVDLPGRYELRLLNPDGEPAVILDYDLPALDGITAWLEAQSALEAAPEPPPARSLPSGEKAMQPEADNTWMQRLLKQLPGAIVQVLHGGPELALSRSGERGADADGGADEPAAMGLRIGLPLPSGELLELTVEPSGSGYFLSLAVPDGVDPAAIRLSGADGQPLARQIDSEGRPLYYSDGPGGCTLSVDGQDFELALDG